MSVPESVEDDNRRYRLAVILSHLYEDDWFLRHYRKVSLTLLEFLRSPNMKGVVGVSMLAMMLKGEGIRKVDAIRLMERWIIQNNLTKKFTSKDVKRFIERAYGDELGKMFVEAMIKQTMGEMVTLGDDRMIGASKSEHTLYLALLDMKSRASVGFLNSFPVTLAMIVEVSGLTKPTVISTIRKLEERGILTWIPGHKTGSTIELHPPEDK